MLTEPENTCASETTDDTTEYNYHSPGSFYCFSCKFTTSKKCVYDKHILTKKHLYAESVNNAYEQYADSLSDPNYVLQPLPPDSIIRTSHKCICGKIYKHRQSLCIHKKKCTYVCPPYVPPPTPIDAPPSTPIDAPPCTPIDAPTPDPSIERSPTPDPDDDHIPARKHTSTLTNNRPPKLITNPDDIIMVPPFTPEQLRATVFAIDSYETAVNEPSVNTFPDTVKIPVCASSAILVTAESLAANISADNTISAIANTIATSYSEETRELCIHREVVVRCIKLVLPIYLNLLRRMNMQEDEDLPVEMIEEIDPDAPITVGYIALKSCVNILYFILSRIDEDPINENDDVIDITNSR